MSVGTNVWNAGLQAIEITNPAADPGQTSEAKASIVVSATGVPNSTVTLSSPSKTWTSVEEQTSWVTKGHLTPPGGMSVATLTVVNQPPGPQQQPSYPTPSLRINGNITTYTFAGTDSGPSTQIAITMAESGGGV